MKIDLKPDELDFLSTEVGAKLVTYMGHHARGNLFPPEITKMNWLKKLSAKLDRATRA